MRRLDEINDALSNAFNAIGVAVGVYGEVVDLDDESDSDAITRDDFFEIQELITALEERIGNIA